MLVFLYGTLLDPRIFARAAGTRAPLRRGLPARLPGFRRVTLRGTPYPTLLRGAAAVDGLLVLVPPRCLHGLSAYEGASYRLTPVRVHTRRGLRAARAWIAAAWRADAASPWFPRHRGTAGMDESKGPRARM